MEWMQCEWDGREALMRSLAGYNALSLALLWWHVSMRKDHHALRVSLIMASQCTSCHITCGRINISGRHHLLARGRKKILI
jgi:hypothetical protein